VNSSIFGGLIIVKEGKKSASESNIATYQAWRKLHQPPSYQSIVFFSSLFAQMKNRFNLLIHSLIRLRVYRCVRRQIVHVVSKGKYLQLHVATENLTILYWVYITGV